MGVIEAIPKTQADTEERPSVINDFSIVVATANGTGSQTSNMAILRAFFKMGIPVNGKNIFPSNINSNSILFHKCDFNFISKFFNKFV